MILIATHFSKNKGTTDFFVDHLVQDRHSFYLLKHPFGFAEIQYSELYEYTDGVPKLLARYKKIKPDILNLLRDFFISVYVSFKLGSKVDKVLSFGSFNAVPFIATNLFHKRKVSFWGVDYSRKRFGNAFLNKVYFILEDISCKYSDLVVHHTKRQETARVENHQLDISKSLICPTGFKVSHFEKDFSKYTKPALLYIGSITDQHGIVDFVDFFYVKHDTNIPLYIIGAGNKQAELQEVLKGVKQQDRVTYLGYKNQQEIESFVRSMDAKVFGVAPYTDTVNDHVFYGDAIKVKEYLAYNMPFIISNVAYVSDELAPFGIIYSTFSDLQTKLEKDLQDFQLNIARKDEALAQFSWDAIFDKLITSLKI